MNKNFELFAHEQTARLLRTAYLLTGNQQDAEDLVQDTMVKALTHWKRIVESRHPPAYVNRILINLFLSGRRRRRPDVKEFDVQKHGDSVPDPADAIADRDAITQGLESLPDRERTAVVLKHYLHLDNHELALAMGTADSTARSTLSRGLRSLRGRLESTKPSPSQGAVQDEHVRD